jgi:ABC-type multidrug transport system fused ATPase/permease subunit
LATNEERESVPAVLRLFGYLRPYWVRTLVAVLSMLGSAGFSLVVPWLTGLAIDVGIDADRPYLLYLFAAAVVASTLLRGLSAFGQTYSGEWLAQRVAYDLRNAIYDHVQNLSFSFHDRNQTGELMSRATADVEAVRWFFAFAVTGLLQIVLLLLGIFAILVQMNLKLAVVTLAFVPVALLAAVRVSSILRPSWARIQEQMATMTTYLQESLAGIRVVRSFARERERIAGFRAENDELHRLQVRQSRLQAFNMPFMTLILSLATAVSLWVGGRDVIEGTLSVGELVAYLGYLTLLALPVRRPLASASSTCWTRRAMSRTSRTRSNSRRSAAGSGSRRSALATRSDPRSCTRSTSRRYRARWWRCLARRAPARARSRSCCRAFTT